MAANGCDPSVEPHARALVHWFVASLGDHAQHSQSCWKHIHPQDVLVLPAPEGRGADGVDAMA
jgi:hypothetical protein